ncbi:effector-associated constant component EACC1 [Streptomyces brasiliensis]|uniref:Uncharacterized protein n=1 Tax=Streptomyces brasiliensis TaxID=1954 RepID=A0A917KJX4_9ACTN|nr:hypothetical protein [Streptomyces brasiliensis]GGJ17131.1 hypothetical protein GCM10010121_029890 [Streptomyces brasiliensis]
MAEGDAVPELGVRVRLDGRASGSDVTALKTWLEREKPLEERMSEDTLRIQERPRTDQPQGHMGFGTEIVLVLAGSATSAAVTELVRYVERAVKAWLENRRRVESGEEPRASVSSLDSDER